MNAATKITFGKFSATGCAGDSAEAYVYANGERVGEIWRHLGRERAYDGAWLVFSYVVQIWMDDVGNNDPAFVEYVRDSRNRRLQTPAQAKRALKRQIAEYLNA